MPLPKTKVFFCLFFLLASQTFTSTAMATCRDYSRLQSDGFYTFSEICESSFPAVNFHSFTHTSPAFRLSFFSLEPQTLGAYCFEHTIFGGNYSGCSYHQLPLTKIFTFEDQSVQIFFGLDDNADLEIKQNYSVIFNHKVTSLSSEQIMCSIYLLTSGNVIAYSSLNISKLPTCFIELERFVSKSPLLLLKLQKNKP